MDIIYLNSVAHKIEKNKVWTRLEASGDSICPRGTLVMDTHQPDKDIGRTKLRLLIAFLKRTNISEFTDLHIFMDSDALASQWHDFICDEAADVLHREEWEELLSHFKKNYVRRPIIWARGTLSALISEEMQILLNRAGETACDPGTIRPFLKGGIEIAKSENKGTDRQFGQGNLP